MQNAYSCWGSRLHLVLEDKIAEGYNRWHQHFMDAQIRYKEQTGQKWTPNEPLLLPVDPEAEDAYNKVANVINLLVEINGGGLDIPEEECTSDFLVKL